MNPELRQFECIFCSDKFESPSILVNDDLHKFNNCDLDCPTCGKTMVIIDGQIKDGTDVINGRNFGFIQIPISQADSMLTIYSEDSEII